METAVELLTKRFEHGYDAMSAFLEGDWFELASGPLKGQHTNILCWIEGTEFLIHYAKIINDYAYSSMYPRADRQFSVRFKKPITKTN